MAAKDKPDTPVTPVVPEVKPLILDEDQMSALLELHATGVGGGRKGQLIDILSKAPTSAAQVATTLDIESKNASSVKRGLVQEGYVILTDEGKWAMVAAPSGSPFKEVINQLSAPLKAKVESIMGIEPDTAEA